MLVKCQIFGDLFLFGLVWQYSSIQKNIMKVGSKPRLLTCISNITLSLPSLYFSESKRELNFCNGYLSLLYFCDTCSIFGLQAHSLVSLASCIKRFLRKSSTLFPWCWRLVTILKAEGAGFESTLRLLLRW